MPSTATITSTDVTTFVAGTKAKASQVNGNFTVSRGHLLPINTDTSSSSHQSHDLGASTHEWRTLYLTNQPVVAGVTSTGGSGGSGGGIETLMQKLEYEKYDLFTENLDNALGFSGKKPKYIDSLIGRLLQEATIGASSLDIVWGPQVLSSTDQNTDTTTGWSVQGGATLLASTITGFRIGTSILTFDKAATETSATILHTLTTSLFVGGTPKNHWRINLPITTNLVAIRLKVYGPTTTDFRQWDITTTASGGALASGWNKMSQDLTSITASTIGGAGWTSGTAIGRWETGVFVSSAAQTYSQVGIDSVCFGVDVGKYGLNSSEVTIFNNSTRQSVILDASNTVYDGTLNLKSTQSITAQYVGGFSGVTVAGVQRSMLQSSNGAFSFDASSTSGTVGTTQEFRASRLFRESSSKARHTIIDVDTPINFEAASIGATTIAMNDYASLGAELLSGNTVDIFRPKYYEGETSYVFLKSATLTASATSTGNITTIDVGTTGVASVLADDLIIKRHLILSTSWVAESVNESFSVITPDTAPNGIQIVDTGFGYPNSVNIMGHYFLGGVNNAEAGLNRKGSLPNLSVIGTLNTSNSFQRGRYSASGFSVGNYFNIPVVADSASIDGDVATSPIFQFSLWFYVDAHTGVNRALFSRFSGASGYTFSINSSNELMLHTNGINIFIGSVPTTGKWHHVFLIMKDGASSYVYFNEVISAAFTPAITSSGDVFRVGAGDGAGATAISTRLSNLTIWKGGAEFTQAQVSYIYNKGNFRPINTSSAARYKYIETAATGRRASVKAELSRSVTSVNATILKGGLYGV